MHKRRLEIFLNDCHSIEWHYFVPDNKLCVYKLLIGMYV